MAQKLTVVVTGSTGKQGGAVARGLLERGHKVRAVTRDPNSSQGRSLANAGATLIAASLEDIRMYGWFDSVGFAADRAALRREFPDVAFHDFESWAKTQDWHALLQSA